MVILMKTINTSAALSSAWIIFLVCSGRDIHATEQDSPSDSELASIQARTALEYVEQVRNSPCKGGTEETLPVQFDHSTWSTKAEVAVRMSNLLTKSVVRNGNEFSGLTDEYLFDLVRNNVDGSALIFGSAIAVEEFTYPGYRTFCPYAFRKDTVYAYDLSLNYDYLAPSTEWYFWLQQKDWSTAYVSRNLVTYRYNISDHDRQRSLGQPMARLEDGHWTLPYYDCGGGDIWMVTYSSPIFGLIDGKPVFRGIGTIDIELTNIDINQCDPEEGTSQLASEQNPQAGSSGQSVDVFRGTHHCQPSTKCVPIVGQGFRPGAYKCACADGYYFPDVSATPEAKYFNGSVLESWFLDRTRNVSADDLAGNQCLKCAEGCDACVDDSPCLYSYNLPLRVALAIMCVLLVIMTVVTSSLVAIFKDKTAIKSASPIFLHVMCGGAALMVIPMFMLFAEPNDITCVVAIWPRHLGFCLAYGALLLKTYRVAAIFKVKSAQKLSLTDRILAQRFAPIMAVCVVYLVAWCVVERPHTVWRRSPDDLKYLHCSSGWWGHGAIIGEAIFLLWGAYLCYVVRKAPSHFNESKYITWSIYNTIILGSFLIIAKEFIAINEGPDIIYIFDFVYTEVCVAGLMCLIFVPKFYAIYRNTKEPDSDVANSTITGRQRAGTSQLGTMDWAGGTSCHKAVQVTLIGGQGDTLKPPMHNNWLQTKSKVYPAAAL